MIKVAITGNIASGKSQVEKILSAQGFKVVDADKINHNLITNNINIISKIKSTFGIGIFNSNNEISKQKLGELVFSSPRNKQLLEDILHKSIKEEIYKFFECNKKEKIVFVSVPLLFEVKWENEFDKIIFVSAPEKLRLNRLIERNNYSEEYAKQRISAQESEESKIIKSDFVIYNDSDFEHLRNSVFDVLSSLK